MVVKPNKSGGAYAKSGYTDMQGELITWGGTEVGPKD